MEINVRQTVFYPEKTGINYITVRGFTLEDAATPWAPPTAEQIGLIGTHWSKGWIIENNKISYSICSGISLGKYGDEWDNTSANTAEGYVKTIERALANGWSKENIGHHIVRNNTISHCEQAGIVGSLGAAFSTVTGNTIHDIHVRQLFSGAEMAGIKFHGAIDVEISHNHIYRTCRGLWLDWMAQGTRVSRKPLPRQWRGCVCRSGSRAVPDGQQPFPLARRRSATIRRAALTFTTCSPGPSIGILSTAARRPSSSRIPPKLRDSTTTPAATTATTTICSCKAPI